MKTAARLEALSPYQPVQPVESLAGRLGRPAAEILKLDANENPYGMSPRAREALASLANGHIYPDPESRELRRRLAEFTGTPVEYLLAGAGADELIDLLLRVVLEPGDCVLICSPTFGMYTFDTLLNGGQVVDVPRRADYSLDLDAIQETVARTSPRLFLLASPNNPDGRRLTREELEAILELPLLVVLDEAYIEFGGEGWLGENASQIRLVPERENLIVLRTMSKWAGLAGLRVGYGAFPSWLLPVLWKAKQPYNVNAAAVAAALATLDDLEERAEKVERLRAERERLAGRLAALPFLQVYPSEANFLLCRVIGMEATTLFAVLEKEGIRVRHYDTPGLRDCLRISIGKPEATGRITRVLLAQVQDETLRLEIERSWEQDRFLLEGDLIQNLTGARRAVLERQTRETHVKVALNLDGSGKCRAATGIGFLDHMLQQIATHGGFDLEVWAQGDLAVDPHHTVEDVALALGEVFDRALAERRGIRRCGWALFPMDETLAEVAVDFSGRPYTVFQVQWNAPAVGNIPNSLWAHFFESFASRAGCTLHASVRYGSDDHHQVEALFKALARALAMATTVDPGRSGEVRSSKGTVSL